MARTGEKSSSGAGRTPLSRDRVLRAAVELADTHGIEGLSMRKLAGLLGVDPMSLYNHVANKDDLLGGMADVVIGEIEQADGAPGEWRATLRAQVLSARRTMLRHPWAREALERTSDASPAVMRYYDRVAGLLLDGGFSVDLMHHALHVLGSRLLGFTQELFDDSGATAQGPEVLALMAHQMAGEFPNLAKMMLQISHDEATVVGSGCNDQHEFEFGLDLLLDGLDRLASA